jgi:hypothetical protein
MLLNPLTRTGVSRVPAIVPSPDPWLNHPQAQTVPVAFQSKSVTVPGSTSGDSIEPITPTGVLRSVLLPSPNSPRRFVPQPQTIPVNSAKRSPAATAVTSFRTSRTTGLSGPPLALTTARLRPHAHTAPGLGLLAACADVAGAARGRPARPQSSVVPGVLETTYVTTLSCCRRL